MTIPKDIEDIGGVVMTVLNSVPFWLGIILVSVAILVIIVFLMSIKRLASYVEPIKDGARPFIFKRVIFKLAVALLGLGLVLIGYNLVEARIDLLGGFLLVIGIQTFFWVIGIRLEMLGNVTEKVYESQWEADAPRRTPSTIRQ
jgi:hypothetical protein